MKKIAVGIILALIVIGAVLLFAKRKADLVKAPTAQALPVVVEAVTLKRREVSLTLPAMGMVASDLSATLSTRVSGQILRVMKQEGDSVRKGEILATIEAADLAAKKEGLQFKQEGLSYQIAAAEENVKALTTALDNARESHARTLELLNVKGASIEESRREESEIAGNLARLAAGQNSISTLRKEEEALAQNIKEVEALARYATITAPVGGTISQRLAMPGDLAQPGKPLFRIAAGTGLYLNLSLPEPLSAKAIILHGKKLSLTTKNEAGATGLGQYTAPLADDSGLVEGQYLNVRVVVFEGNGVLLPVDGLLTVGGESFVFIYEDGKAVKTRVDIVARGSEGVVVSQDLAGKKLLLAKPDLLLRVAAGAPVLLTGGEGGSND